MFLIRITYSYPCIGNLYFYHIDIFLNVLYHNRNPATFRSELKCISQQIHHNLTYLVGIESHCKMIYTRKERKVYLLFIGHQQERIAYPLYVSNDISFRK